MAKKGSAKNPFTGRWRIISVSAWDEQFIDMTESALGNDPARHTGLSEASFDHPIGRNPCVSTEAIVPYCDLDLDEILLLAGIHSLVAREEKRVGVRVLLSPNAMPLVPEHRQPKSRTSA